MERGNGLAGCDGCRSVSPRSLHLSVRRGRRRKPFTHREPAAGLRRRVRRTLRGRCQRGEEC